MNLHLAIAKILWFVTQLTHGDVPQLAIKDGDDLSGKAHQVVVEP